MAVSGYAGDKAQFDEPFKTYKVLKISIVIKEQMRKLKVLDIKKKKRSSCD